MYYAKKTHAERKSTGPYPLSHLLSKIDHADFQPPESQDVEKTDEFTYSDLSQFFVMVSFVQGIYIIVGFCN